MIATTTVGSVERRALLTLRSAVPLVIAAVAVWRIFGGVEPTERFFDDFFYYIKPGQNWVEGRGATFFPGEPTNGYHPLWFVWLTCLYVFAHGETFFALVDISVALLLIGFFVLFERFLRRVTGQALAGTVGASVAAIAIAPKAFMGLEMALTVFAAALLLDYITRKPLAEQFVGDALRIGLLGSLLVLSRIDAALLAPGLLLAVVNRWDWPRIAAAVVGAAPLGIYFGLNWVWYGHLGTTSMAAKSLALYLPPNLHFIAVEIPVPGAAEIGIVVAAAVVYVLSRRCENVDARRIGLALTAAPILQFCLQALMSGWKLFPWYLYYDFMVLGLAAALVVMQFERMNVTKRIGVPIAVVVAVFMALWLVSGVRPDHYQRDIAEMSKQLQSFSTDHPGIYAMGDAAGTPAWVMQEPIVHLEGLMMSHDFVERIAQQQPLEQVFHDYHVNYYVTARPESVDAQGCLHFLEPSPAQSSDRAPHMAMTICEPPIADFREGSYHLRIFQIDPTTGKSA
ncbi:hypothetical protein [Mycolicibacterium moriokaense]|uniref:Glycosyltransferase RgtA/B/C/D-like domain-containing protein n=1 Tax=Mycolicibacterium moriokaense TaxID=39691 RepID=A0A318H892_9MYCO|nr:hypothetical protein [Mycolicibacterium moriokaense]PXW99118.1 hypothetical protein C8E89_1425 [Mycolicibacterium moriokaense]